MKWARARIPTGTTTYNALRCQICVLAGPMRTWMNFMTLSWNKKPRMRWRRCKRNSKKFLRSCKPTLIASMLNSSRLRITWRLTTKLSQDALASPSRSFRWYPSPTTAIITLPITSMRCLTVGSLWSLEKKHLSWLNSSNSTTLLTARKSISSRTLKSPVKTNLFVKGQCRSSQRDIPEKSLIAIRS